MKHKNVAVALLSLVCVVSAGFGLKATIANAATEAPSFEMNTGASIRTQAPAGIRFQTKILKTEYEALAAKNAKYGTLVIPKVLLGEDELTATVDASGTVTAASNVLVVNASNINTTEVDNEKTAGVDESLYNYYHAVIVGEKVGDTFTGLPEEYYDVELVARSYVVYDGDNGKVLEYATNTATRSIAEVANKVIIENSDKYSDTEYANFHDITDYVANKNTLSSMNGSAVAVEEEVQGVYVLGEDEAVETTNWSWADGTLSFTSDYISTLESTTTLKVLADGAIYSLNVVVYGEGTTIALNKSVDVDFSEDVTTYALNLGENFDVDAVVSAELSLVKNGVLYASVGDKTPLEVAGVEGTSLQVSKDVAKAVPAGIYNASVQAVADGVLNTYTFELHLITKIVKTAEEFVLLSIQSNPADNIYTNEERSQGYFVLGANIEFPDDKLFYTISTENFSGIFDGRGYNIDGFTTSTTANQSSLIAKIQGGIVRNVSFTNAVKGKGGGGLICSTVTGWYANESDVGSWDVGVNDPNSVGWHAELTNIFVSGEFASGGTYVSMLFSSVVNSKATSIKNSIIIDNIVVEITANPLAADGSWSALQGASKTYTGAHMNTFDNIYVFGTEKLGRITSTGHVYGIWQDWINKGTGNVNAYADGVLTQEIGEKIVANGSIWNYENGKLTMKNAGTSVELK